MKMHISQPYRSFLGRVWAYKKDPDDLRNVTMAVAKRSGLRVVRCAYCPAPAKYIDHYHPYHMEATTCEQHKDWPKHAKRKYRLPNKKA